jgi:glutaredoxin
MSAPKEKPKVFIFVNDGSRATTVLTGFIAKNIDKINEKLIIKMVKINKKNFEICKRKGVRVAPTLIYGKKHITGVDDIIKVLSPPQTSKDGFGQGYSSADEYVHSYQDSILNTGGDEEEDEMDPSVREQVLRQKMAALQKRRPQMSDNVDTKQRLRGGRKTKAVSPKQSSFANDEEFYRATGVDNVQTTPSSNYMDESDGNLILEEWYLAEANQAGKKVGKVVSKRR